jgi:hypothetical protein
MGTKLKESLETSSSSLDARTAGPELATENARKTRRNRLLLISLLAVGLVSVANWFLVRWIGLEIIPVRQWTIGSSHGKPPMVALGSSFTFFGIGLNEVAEKNQTQILCRSAASASPCELEQLYPRGAQPELAIIGVSAYDLNEQILGDFRAEIVPLTRSISDLVESRADWAFIKKLLGQYALSWTRKIFPAAGRSTSIMTGLRDKAVNTLKRFKGEPVPKHLAVDIHYTSSRPERLEDWEPSRLESALAMLRATSNNKHEFAGPKHLALKRLLSEAKGRVLVVVLPVSPPYQSHFITTSVEKSFEASLADAARAAPTAVWLRLDQRPEYRNSKVFWDTGHMNDEGKTLATKAVLGEIERMK